MDEPSSLKISIAMLGARRHYAVPRLLHEAGYLNRFYTDSYIGNKPWLRYLLEAVPEKIRPRYIRQWLGRLDATIPSEKVISFELFGLWYAIARRGAKDPGSMERVFLEAASRFAQNISRKGLDASEVLWGFNTASLELFRLAKSNGMFCVLEQTILPGFLERKLLAEEGDRWPDWNIEPHSPNENSIYLKRDANEKEEWALADVIVAGSEFVRAGLLEMGVPKHKIRVVPYGVAAQGRKRIFKESRIGDESRLKVLFAGEVGLRKGVPDLLQAFDMLPTGSVDLRLAGGIKLAESAIAPWRSKVQFLGAVPRSEMQALFQWADIFVLPSIVEGSALVTYEALLSGLPVITTPNAGSIVRHGIDGCIVPIRTPAALAEAISQYNKDRSRLSAHRVAASSSAEFAGLDRYRSQLVKVVQDLVDEQAASCGPS